MNTTEALLARLHNALAAAERELACMRAHEERLLVAINAATQLAALLGAPPAEKVAMAPLDELRTEALSA